MNILNELCEKYSLIKSLDNQIKDIIKLINISNL